MAQTLENQGAKAASRRVHIKLANEIGFHMPLLSERHKADKLARLRSAINRLASDPEVGGLAVVAVINAEAAEIMKGHVK